MGYLDRLAEAIIVAAAERPEIEWSWCGPRDGRILVQIFTEDENGTESRTLLSPGEFAKILGISSADVWAA